MESFVLNNRISLSIESWEKSFPRLVAGISTKNGGSSKGQFVTLNLGYHVGDIKDTVSSNRNKLSKHLQFPLNHWVGAEQIHDNLIRKVTRADKGKGADSYSDAFKGTDGFYTKDEGILLTLAFADCVPLFFISAQHKMIGTAHAGWKGTVNEIARHMVEAWNREGVPADTIFAAIGPSICEECYIVNDYVINFVENILEDSDKKPYNLVSEGQYTLDLRELNKLILIKAGVPKENILITSLCTSCDENLFYSHRRDKGKTGRMLSYIGWKETEGEGNRKS